MSAKDTVRELAALAGITVNGPNPWDLKVNDERFYGRVLRQGSLGFGESYMDGWWDCEQIEELFYLIFTSGVRDKIKPNADLYLAFLKSKLFNMQSKVRSRRVAEDHYDLPTEIYMSFLDPYNQYTSACFEGPEDLNTAQEQTLELICKKLQLKSSDNVLDIGCGWGGFAKFAAEHCGCRVVGVSISSVQIGYAKNYCQGLPVDIIYSDYRDLAPEFTGAFDKVLIRGMIEHVGRKNYRRLMRTVHRCLNDGHSSLFLLDTLGGNTSVSMADPWVDEYVFPGGMAPSIEQLGRASQGLFIVEDWHNFGFSYYKTLIGWDGNFEENWDKTREQLKPYYDNTLKAWCARNLKGSWSEIKDRYDERFRRKFKYYFLSFAGSIKARRLQQWQIVLSKRGVPGGYKPSLPGTR